MDKKKWLKNTKAETENKKSYMQTQIFLCITIPVESQITNLSFPHY